MNSEYFVWTPNWAQMAPQVGAQRKCPKNAFDVENVCPQNSLAQLVPKILDLYVRPKIWLIIYYPQKMGPNGSQIAFEVDINFGPFRSKIWPKCFGAHNVSKSMYQLLTMYTYNCSNLDLVWCAAPVSVDPTLRTNRTFCSVFLGETKLVSWMSFDSRGCSCDTMR